MRDSNSTIKWIQNYGFIDDTINSSFNAKVMNIKNILFDIKGEKGGEVIYVFFSNVYGKTARGAKIIRLSDNCQTISIPLLLFDDGILELRSLCTITIQTIRSFGGSTKSHILIDNLAFDWTE